MNTFTFASWNVNSLRVRLPQLIDWLGRRSPDAVVIQETKLVDEQFPVEVLKEAGYHVAFTGQKTYNGVALLARAQTFEAPADVVLNLPGYPDDQKRLVAATLRPRTGEAPVRFIGGYIPNGNELGSWKYLYKLDWLDAAARFLKDELSAHPRVVMGGDFNIAPDDRDVYDVKLWTERVLTSRAERRALNRLLALGLSDSFRVLHPEAGQFSWWDYRQSAFLRDRGLRIDLLLVSEAVRTALISAEIDKEPRALAQPSDHAPVLITFTA